jgi:hypothetical protein
VARKDKTIWWLVALGGVGAWWYFSKKATPTAPATLPAPALLLPTPEPLPASIPVSNTTVTTLPSSPQLQFNAPVAPPSAPAVALTAASPLPAASTGPTVDQMNTLQSWAQSGLSACDLARWNQYKTAFTTDEWSALIDIYFNDWIGGQGITDQREQEWDAWRNKYQILTNTPC